MEVAAILFGLLTFVVPGLTLTALVLLLEGLVVVAAGLVTFLLPGLTAVTLVYIIGAWAIITGVLEIVAAVRLRQQLTGEWWLVLSGVLSVGFGVLVMLRPAAGALAMVLWIGAYAIVFGALLLALAFRLRRAQAELRDVPFARAA